MSSTSLNFVQTAPKAQFTPTTKRQTWVTWSSVWQELSPECLILLIFWKLFSKRKNFWCLTLHFTCLSQSSAPFSSVLCPHFVCDARCLAE